MQSSLHIEHSLLSGIESILTVSYGNISCIHHQPEPTPPPRVPIESKYLVDLKTVNYILFIQHFGSVLWVCLQTVLLTEMWHCTHMYSNVCKWKGAVFYKQLFFNGLRAISYPTPPLSHWGSNGDADTISFSKGPDWPQQNMATFYMVGSFFIPYPISLCVCVGGGRLCVCKHACVHVYVSSCMCAGYGGKEAYILERVPKSLTK